MESEVKQIKRNIIKDIYNLKIFRFIGLYWILSIPLYFIKESNEMLVNLYGGLSIIVFLFYFNYELKDEEVNLGKLFSLDSFKDIKIILKVLIITSLFLLLFKYSKYQIGLENLRNRSYETKFIFFTIIIPLKEELLFRGVILNRLEKVGIFISVLISSFLFMIFVDGDYFFYFLFGLLLSFIYLRTKSLIVPLITHTIVNLFLWITYFY